MTDELEAIRARHEEAEQDNNSDWAANHGARAHFDRETLLRLLDANEIFRQLAERQEPLGADFEAAVGDLSTLYETDVPGANEVETSAWTDDDQRGLNAAVADAMWHWDTRNEGPLDPDDAISLAEALKFHLKDNGFQIVRLATRAQGKSS